MRVLVIGGGMAGLVAAHACLDRGFEVLLLEAGERLGGRVAGVELDGAVVDGGAESFAVRGGAVRALLDRLDLGGDVVDPVGSAWVALADRTVPLPSGGLLGIPSSPLATDVVAAIGVRAAVRAYADRLLPSLRVGRYDRLGPLVRRRMGEEVLRRLVAPVVESVYGVDPDDAPVDAIAPGLNRAITETGALSAAVLRLRTAAPPGAAAQGLVGGVHRLPEALADRLRGRGAELRTGAPVEALEQVDGGGWSAAIADGRVDADAVVVAVDGAAALDLVAGPLPALATMARPRPVTSRAVLLAIDDPRLDAAPRGTGVLRAAERTGVAATALTHASAKWPWLAAALPPHRHVLRLAYRGDERPDDRAVHADAAALLGTGLAEPAARRDVVWADTAPALAPETLALRRALADGAPPAGLAVTGAWTAGTGLASVVGHARAAVERLPR